MAVARRRGIVLQVAGTGNEGFVVVACVEEHSVRICTVLDHGPGQFLGRHKPSRIKAGLVQL